MFLLTPALIASILAVAGYFYESHNLMWLSGVIFSAWFAIIWTLSEIYERATGKPLDDDLEDMMKALILRRPFKDD